MIESPRCSFSHGLRKAVFWSQNCHFVTCHSFPSSSKKLKDFHLVLHSSQLLSSCLLLAEGSLAKDHAFLLEVEGDNCLKATDKDQVCGTRNF